MAAIYQWFENGRFIDYEYVIIAQNDGYLGKYLGFDFDSGEYTEFGSLPLGGNRSVATDGISTFSDNLNFNRDITQYVWRGHCFTKVKEIITTNTNGSNTCQIVGGSMSHRIQTSGGAGFAAGFKYLTYSSVAPYSPGPVNSVLNSAGDPFGEAFDFKFTNRDSRDLGDAIVYNVGENDRLTSYQPNLGAWQKVSELLVPVDSGFYPVSWGHDRWNGTIAHVLLSPQTRMRLYDVNMSTLVISHIGIASVTGKLWTVGFTDSGLVITVEEVGGTTTHLRVYSRSGTTLTMLSDYPLFGGTNVNTRIKQSPITGRYYILGVGSMGSHIVDIDGSSGAVNFLFWFPIITIGTSGTVGMPIAFVAEPLTTTPNGFTGIKSKLYECWEMEEATGIRYGSMGNQDWDTSLVASRAGTVGDAADFDGTNNLIIGANNASTEILTQGSFSLCMDVVLDSKASLQYIFGRGIRNASSLHLDYYDFGISYDPGSDRIRFEVRDGWAIYYAVANNLGSPTIGQKYHIYVQYDKSIEQIAIKIDNGTANTTTLPLAFTINMKGNSNCLFAGRYSEHLPESHYLDGSLDQVFWFWDVLDSDEQTFMYNGGSSRSFGEL